MNLRSRKVMCNRHKHSSASACDEIKQEQDIISKLPNELLTLIISFLPEADAVRTCIFSSRWKFIWMFLPTLRLIMPFCWSIEEANKFHDSVDRILAVRGNTPCKSFYLYCSKNCDYNRVYDWLCTILKCKVQEIELRFPADRFTVKFPWDLFRTSYTLVELTLRGEFVLDVPESDLLFPCLKKLNLVSIVYVGDQTITNLISACPLLEELFVERQVIGTSDNIQMFKVSSSSLKRLRISFALCVSGDYPVVIDAPNLVYMYIVDIMSTHFTFTKPLFLVEAYINIVADINTESLLLNLSSVKTLTMADSTLMTLDIADDLDIPIFQNLVKFVIGLDVHDGWHLLPRLFESMPNLEDITFLKGLLPFPREQHLFNMRWNPPLEVPHCLLYKMKQITILNQKDITQEELPLIRYLLKHSRHLEMLRINAHRLDLMIHEQLSSSPRGSGFCRIEFVWGHSRGVFLNLCKFLFFHTR